MKQYISAELEIVLMDNDVIATSVNTGSRVDTGVNDYINGMTGPNIWNQSNNPD